MLPLLFQPSGWAVVIGDVDDLGLICAWECTRALYAFFGVEYLSTGILVC